MKGGNGLDHAITIGDVLLASGAIIGGIVILAIILAVLSVIANGFKH